MVKASEILYLSDKRDRTDSKVIAANLEIILSDNGYKRRDEQIEILAEITESSSHTCHAWLNAGRRDVKIPFIKLCKIADRFNIDIEKIMEE